MTQLADAQPGRAGVASALALAGLLALLGPLAACMSRSEPAANQVLDTKTVLIPVEGMSCAACAARAKKALASVGGVSDVEVSLIERRARVRFDPARASAAQLVAAINGLGYRAGAAVEGK